MPRKREDVKKLFLELFHSDPIQIVAPGRINIIGEHTDYNDGFVLPAAIDKAASIFIQKSGDDTVKLVSIDMDGIHSFLIHDQLTPVEAGWVNYFLGIIDQFQSRGHRLGGFNLMFTSDIPIGSGLSSSAALECGFAFALCELFELDVEPVTLAQIGQQAEHKFAGVKCGIMDQFASCMGKAGHVIKLDCRDLSYEYYPSDFKNYDLVLFDSNVKHNLADSAYNVRRLQCEEGVAVIQSNGKQMTSLRDVSLFDLESAKTKMSDVVYRRCKYVVEENLRVQQVCEALKLGDIHQVGQLMSETHQGLCHDYEVSCIELDTLIDIAGTCEGHIGGRMMGGGFGGCTINLIRKDKVEEVIEKVVREYKKATTNDTKVYRVAIGDGVGKYKEKANYEV